jgi:ankyrin repeat protein
MAKLLQAHADVNAVSVLANGSSATALDVATALGDEPTVKWLRDQQAKPAASVSTSNDF